jgi:hypothetical protein
MSSTTSATNNITTTTANGSFRVTSGGRRRKTTARDLALWRRMEVARLLSIGKSVNDIAKLMNLDPRTIFRDKEYIREHSSEILDRYLVETLPYELSKCLLRLNQVSNEAWAIVYREGTLDRDKISALSQAEKAAIDIMDLLTNNKTLVNEAMNGAFTGVPSGLKLPPMEEKKERDSNNNELSGEAAEPTRITDDPQAVF